MPETCKKKVSELMLPLSEYAVVDDKATVADALKTLKEKNDEYRGKKHPHRAVLVKNSKERIIGKIGHQSILKGILDNPVREFEKHALTIMGSHQDMVSRASQNLNLLDENLDVLIERARSISVSKVMQPIACKIDENDSLIAAMRLFTDFGGLSLLVTRKDKAVGIIRLADLFDEIAENIRKSD